MSDHPAVDASVYEAARQELGAAIDRNASARDAQQIVCAALDERFAHYSWVGIYLVEGNDLVLAAWSGPEATEHTRIPVGAGICGLAAATGETELVPDVAANPAFIACFASTRSEIVVPILGPDGVLGEIDIDSDYLDAFDEADRRLLEDLAARLARRMAPAA